MEHTAFRAEDYDAKIRQTLPFYDEFYEQVVDALAISGRKNVSWLDIGCGTDMDVLYAGWVYGK